MYSSKEEHARYYRDVARNEWFSRHEVRVTTFKSTENASSITVVDFRRPNSGVYAVRYIFDGHHVYVSGDLGDAVFNCTWKVTPVDKSWNSMWYVFEKLSASENGREMDFDTEVCVSTIKQVLLDSKYEEQVKNGEIPSYYPKDWDECDIRTYLDLIQMALDCSGMDNWSHAIQEFEQDHDLASISSDWWEWLYGAGKVMPPRIVGIITGLQIVSETLNASGWPDEKN